MTKRALNVVFEQLMMHHVLLEGMVLKPNMVISALNCSDQADIATVSKMTAKCLEENVPAEVPGIAFLSGGQSSDLATSHLNEINKIYSNQLPWNISFSYGRALQADALNNWNGNDREKGQKSLLSRAKNNSLATFGKAENLVNSI